VNRIKLNLLHEHCQVSVSIFIFLELGASSMSIVLAKLSYQNIHRIGLRDSKDASSPNQNKNEYCELVAYKITVCSNCGTRRQCGGKRNGHLNQNVAP